jgi:hypothetical protein
MGTRAACARGMPGHIPAGPGPGPPPRRRPAGRAALRILRVLRQPQLPRGNVPGRGTPSLAALVVPARARRGLAPLWRRRVAGRGVDRAGRPLSDGALLLLRPGALHRRDDRRAPRLARARPAARRRRRRRIRPTLRRPGIAGPGTRRPFHPRGGGFRQTDQQHPPARCARDAARARLLRRGFRIVPGSGRHHAILLLPGAAAAGSRRGRASARQVAVDGPGAAGASPLVRSRPGRRAVPGRRPTAWLSLGAGAGSHLVCRGTRAGPAGGRGSRVDAREMAEEMAPPPRCWLSRSQTSGTGT